MSEPTFTVRESSFTKCWWVKNLSRGATELDTMVQQLQNPAPRLPENLLAFQSLIDKMIAKSPDDRFEDMSVVLQNLDRVAGTHYGESVAVISVDQDADTETHPNSRAPDVNRDPSGNPSSRRPAARAIGIALVILLGGFLGWSQLARQKPVTITDADNLESNPSRAVAQAIPNQISEVVVDETAGQKRTDEEVTLTAEVSPSEVDALLAAGDQALGDDRLTTPPKNNANYYYLRVLEIDRNNRDAKRGRVQIANRYHALAQASFNQGNTDKASDYIHRGFSVTANTSRHYWNWIREVNKP